MSKKKKRVLWPVITILSIAACVFVFGHTRRGLATSSAVANAPRLVESGGSGGSLASLVKTQNSAALPAAQPFGPIQMVRFTVYAEGIRPSVVHTTRGLVAIYIEDLSTNSAGLIIQNEARLALGQVVRRQGNWRGSSRMLLVPGQYQVYDASRPRNSATLIVEP